MSHQKMCPHIRRRTFHGAIPFTSGDVFPIKPIEIMESETHNVSKQSCAQCSFLNTEWNSGYTFSISPQKAISPSPTRTNNSLNLSQQSSSSQRLSFEGVGGNTSIPDPVDMHQQISELEFQLRKLTTEKSDLLDQLIVKEDEIVSLQVIPQSQRDDSEKKQHLNKWNIERQRQLSTELDESKNSLTILEDANILLTSKLHQLEKENNDLITQRDSTAGDTNMLLVQLELCRKQLHVRKAEFSMLEDELKEELKHLCAKKLEFEIELSTLNSKLSHLEATNEQLIRENMELKNQSKACIPDQNEFSSFKSLNETFGVEADNPKISPSNSKDDTSVSNTEEQSNSFCFPNPCPSCKINKNSLHAELFAVFMNKDLLSEKENLRKLSEILRVLQSLRQYFVTSSSNTREQVVFIEQEIPVVEKVVTEPEIEPSSELIKAQITQNDIDTAREDVVRRINEELAEFREQLKMSQELFHALSNSAQNVNVTQSCPLLSETDNPKFVDCSTQTAVINETQHSSFYITNHCHDMDNDIEGQEDDKLSDDIRLTINLPTVLEESEQETEASPAAVPKMSSKKGSRRLVRGNATEDDKAEEDIKSDNEYASAVSSPPSSKTASVYNSLERPLHVSGTLGIGSSPRRETDTASIVSGGSETTFGSPLSSPSSPTYWTPSQGSSSQETITNHDGDKTPVNEVYGNDAEFDSFQKSSSSNGIGQTASSWTLPIDNSRGGYPIKGVIPEKEREYMITYAYDPPRRASEQEARILDPDQWRTLKHDLDRKMQEKYTKDFAQEEGHDGDGGGLHYCDLDEEAEQYFEKFPKLVENLFSSLDNIKNKDESPTESQLLDLSKRFQNLAQMFKTEHTTMSHRFELKKTEHENSRRRMKDICDNIKSSIQRSERLTKSQKPPDESTELLLSLKDTSQELENHYITLSRTARRLGMLDVEKRMYKMIEVMVLYVHILKNLYENLNKEYIGNRKLLEQHNISVSSGQSLGQLHNNNNGTVRSIESEDHYETLEVFEDSKPKKILEELLGQVDKKSLRKRLVLRENRSSNNVVVRHVAEWYEVFRRELYWPWSWDQTWKGIKQGFSIILMLVGLFIILKSLFPAVSANECTPVFDLPAVFSKHGSLSHNYPPPI